MILILSIIGILITLFFIGLLSVYYNEYEKRRKRLDKYYKYGPDSDNNRGSS